MAQLIINLDNYESFFQNGEGKKIISEMLENSDLKALLGIASWDKIISEDLDKISEKVISYYNKEKISQEELEQCLDILSKVAENSRMSSQAAEKICDFAIKNENPILLQKIARHSSLTAEIAKKICDADDNVTHWKLTVALGYLAANENTPDDILFLLFKKAGRGDIRDNAAANITNRYKAFKAKLNETEDGQKLLKLLTDIS